MRCLSSALSRLSFFALESPDILVSPRTPQSPPSSLDAHSLARGLVLSTSPYLKSTAANPKVSLTPVAATDSVNTSSSSFDISLISDTSSSCSEGTPITPFRSFDQNDLFSPRHHLPPLNSSFLDTPSPPQLVGLGISGISRRDGKPGNFNGLGLVGIRHSLNSRNPFIISADDDDDDDDGYVSPTPIGVRRRDNDKRDEQDQDDELSDTFMRELVFTWESDPQHTRILSTIPECDNEDELEFQQAAMKEAISAQSVSSAEPPPPVSSPSISPSRYHAPPSPPSPLSTPSPLTLHTEPRLHVVTQAPMPIHRAKSELQVSRVSSRNPRSSHRRSRSSSSSTSVPTQGGTITRATNPSVLRSERDDGAAAAPGKKRRGAWRV